MKKAHKDDYVRLTENGVVSEAVYIDRSVQTKAHLDFIQLLAESENGIRRNYRGDCLSNIEVFNNVLIVDNPNNTRQGIFASDNCFKNLRILRNYISLAKSPHYIAINGMISGEIRDNFCDVALRPLRIGGGGVPLKGIKPVYITGFKDKDMKYKKIKGLKVSEGKKKKGVPFVQDLRKVKQRGGTNLENFRYHDYMADPRIQKGFRSVSKDVENMITIAKEYGDIA